MTKILLSALSARRGGGLTYLRHIVGHFPAEAGHRLYILSAAPIEGLPARDNVEWLQAPAWTVRPITRFLFGYLYFRLFWPLRHDFDAVYFPGGSFDLALPPHTRRIVAFRNMVPFDVEASRRFHFGWTRLRVWLLRHIQSWAFRRADLVIFISEYARRVIDAAIPRRRGASVVIPHGTAPTTQQLEPTIAAQLPDRFVLYLSILDVYKAQVELVEAWGRLIARSPRAEKLVLAGPENPRYGVEVRAAITKLGLEREVIVLGNIPHDQISDLTRRATLNVFLSSCENCPNILLELMAIRTPLLVSAREPMPELGGPDLDYVEPYDVSGIAEALARLLDDSARRERIAEAAHQRSARYSWPKTAAATWEAIIRCGGGDI
ncbi:glycosyltransferase involved in cell wall biosynthesis [Sphingomonas naasensis]|uniref:Glycosyltransferase family 1 protein n=1 Tax=Sphingomonas naasensis TaxID=1344951 RepID=A0A4S1WSU3_9SPHN|nr:glycosyltransferase family 1 protein [Sphingomonas naasensis]NIJ19309.1 glycosyltransferase involved in cell wall biosynthesis [Sphingomonas naasensis]TGX46484.1 glycosyltransferase family 1 protein [Sphingomonas naasensis]